MKKPLKKRFKDMTKKEKARYCCGKASLVLILLAVLLSVFVLSYGLIVAPKTASASTFDTTSYLQSFEVAARQDPEFTPIYPFSVSDPYHTLFRGMPDKYVGVPVVGSNKNKTTSTFDFSTTTTNYSYEVGGESKFYYFKKITLSDPFTVSNIPYLWFMPDHGSNMDASGSGSDWLLILDTLADGSKVFRFIAIYTDLSSKSSVWYQSSWVVDSNFVPFVDGTSSDTSWFQVTGKNANSAANFVTLANTYGRSYEFFDCYNASTGLYSLVSLYPDSRVVNRQMTGIFRGDLRYRFYDQVYADPESNYYNSLFSDLSIDFSRRYTDNVDFVKSIIAPYKDKIDITASDYVKLKEQYDFYKSQYDVLSAQIQSLEYQIGELENSLSVAEQDKTALQGQYDDLNVAFNTLSTNYDNLNKTYDALDSNYNALDSNYQAVVSDYSKLEDSYNALQASYNDLSASKNTLQSSFNALQQKYNALVKDNTTWEEKYAQAFNNGYDQGVSDTKAMNNILTVAPNAVVTIWNGVLAPIFRYDVFGVSIGSIFAGLVCLAGVFLIISKVL